MDFGFTKLGPCQIVKIDGASVQVKLAGRKRPTTVSKTQLIAAPKQMRLVTKASFDQDCGCTPVIDVTGTKIECFNIYGKLSKFLASKDQDVKDLTPHLSRKFLKEHGFVRATGQKPRMVKDVAAFLFEKTKAGYKTLETSTPRKARKVTPAVAEAPVAVAEPTPAAV